MGSGVRMTCGWDAQALHEPYPRLTLTLTLTATIAGTSTRWMWQSNPSVPHPAPVQPSTPSAGHNSIPRLLSDGMPRGSAVGQPLLCVLQQPGCGGGRNGADGDRARQRSRSRLRPYSRRLAAMLQLLEVRATELRRSGEAGKWRRAWGYDYSFEEPKSVLSGRLYCYRSSR